MTPTGGDPPDGIVGREGELAAADVFLASAAERSGVMLIEGEPGIGKSTIWREVARRAHAGGFRVLSARPVEAEAKLALSTVADLFDGVPSEAFAGLPEPQRRALDIALLRAVPAGEPPDPRTIATSVRSLLAELGGERPVVVAVDDIQWLDPASATMLEFALRRSADQPVAWVLARRSGAPAGLAVERAVAPERLTRASLGPLTLGALHHVLRERRDGPLSRGRLVRIYEATGGNPFYALELARARGVGAAGGAGAQLLLPASLRELVAARIPELGHDVRDALLAAAALSQPTVALVEQAASVAGLAEAEESDLVRVDAGRVEFAHPLYASAVYTAAATTRRRDLHRRLAHLVTDPEERARHLALATSDPDEAVASALEAAADLARRRGAWASAAELLERAAAVSAPPGGQDAHRRRIAAADHLVHAGDRPRARVLLESTLTEELSPAARGDALRLLGELSYNDGHVADAGRLLGEALDLADDPARAAAIELGLGNVNAARWRFPAAAAHAHRALAHGEALGDGWLIAEALGQCARLDFMCGRGVDRARIERALALEHPDRATSLQRRPSMQAALLALYEGRHGEARQRLQAVSAAARARGDESDVPFVLLWLSCLETRCANLTAAREIVDDAIALAALTGSPSTHGWLCAQRAGVAAHAGDVDTARRDCAEAEALLENSGYEVPRAWIGAAVALLELSLENPAAAWAACEPLVAVVDERGIGDPVAPFFLPLAVEALVALGRLEPAKALLDPFEDAARRLDRAWALATGGRCRALLLAAGGDSAGAAAAAHAAVAQHRRIDVPFDLARTLLVTGVIQRRQRSRADAKASFEQALDIFQAAGARIWADRARAEIGRLGLRRSSDELTKGERRVAELAAQGRTNREVAAALFLSPKTVDANLSRVYRKLGIRSRAELGARMSGASVDPGTGELPAGAGSPSS